MARGEWPLWLSRYRWAHWMTGTTDKATTPDRILRAFTRWTVRELARQSKARVPYFVMVEQKPHGHPHIHALLGGTQSLRTRDVAARWTLGHSAVTLYNPALGATHYVTKTIGAEMSTDCWDISRRLPPLLDATSQSAALSR